jgi:DNA adenine methylase
MNKTSSLQPFLKWAGGKRQILPEIRKYIPPRFDIYYEPFLGAGAVLFDLQPPIAVVNDSNSQLINCYEVIKNSIDELIKDLGRHKNEEDYYYKIRNLDRKKSFKKLDLVQKASRVIYLNKTCFNGLFRVNSSGEFNVPFGDYKNPKFVNEAVLKAVHDYLNKNQVTILNVDFETAVKDAKSGDFIYFDPPYDPVSETSSFTSYDLNGFGKEEQRRLKKVFKELADRGCYVLLSNSATEFILELYREYSPIRVSATRNINSVASGRGKIEEVLVKNY